MTEHSNHKALESIKLKAPAKVNLRLKLTGRRSDGYHLLSMLNAWLSFGDDLEIERTNTREIVLAVKVASQGLLTAIPADPRENLVYKAAQQFLARFSASCGCNIRLIKNIPAAAGLGGGSSDAAATLQGLAQLFSLGDMNADPDLARQLHELALSLGADVPYFLQGGFCRVSGVGESVQPLNLNCFDGQQIVLVIPPQASSTPEAYATLRKISPHLPDFADEKLDDFCRQVLAGHAPAYSELISLIDNDLCNAVFSLHTCLAQLQQELTCYQDFVGSMSGSGAAFFLLPRKPGRIPEDRFLELKQTLEKRQNQVILASFLPKNTTRVD